VILNASLEIDLKAVPHIEIKSVIQNRILVHGNTGAVDDGDQEEIFSFIVFTPYAAGSTTDAEGNVVARDWDIDISETANYAWYPDARQPAMLGIPTPPVPPGSADTRITKELVNKLNPILFNHMVPSSTDYSEMVASIIASCRLNANSLNNTDSYGRSIPKQAMISHLSTEQSMWSRSNAQLHANQPIGKQKFQGSTSNMIAGLFTRIPASTSAAGVTALEGAETGYDLSTYLDWLEWTAAREQYLVDWDQLPEAVLDAMDTFEEARNQLQDVIQLNNKFVKEYCKCLTRKQTKIREAHGRRYLIYLEKDGSQWEPVKNLKSYISRQITSIQTVNQIKEQPRAEAIGHSKDKEEKDRSERKFRFGA